MVPGAIQMVVFVIARAVARSNPVIFGLLRYARNDAVNVCYDSIV